MYLRLSVEDNEVFTSIDTQREIIKNYIDSKSDFILVKEFIDNGKTGTNFNRTGFLNMIEAVENGEIECIIVKDLSRFGRNMIDTGHYIEKFLPRYNVRFIAINDNFDTNNKDSEGLILPLKNIINETFAKDISFKVRKEVKLSMERGECISSMAPFGYKRIRNNKKNIYVEDKETSYIVKIIYQLALDGLTPTEICRKLNEDSIPTPTAFKKKQGVLKKDNTTSNKWNIPIIKRIISNEVYIGNLIQGTRSKITGKDIKTPKEQWYTVKGNHEAIINEDTFYKVQEIIKKRAEINKHIKIKNIHKKISYFEGKVICGFCNGKLSYIKRGKYYYYTCKTKQTEGESNCVGVMINESAILQTINEELEKYVSVNLKGDNNVHQIQRNTIIKVKKSINDKDIKLKNLYEGFVKAEISKSEYLSLKKVYEEENMKLQKELTELDKIQNLENLKKNVLNKNLDNNVNEKALASIIDSIIVYQDKSIKIKWRH